MRKMAKILSGPWATIFFFDYIGSNFYSVHADPSSKEPAQAYRAGARLYNKISNNLMVIP
jgi:hypothetical protein